MSVISVETKQLGQLAGATGLADTDLLYVELTNGGSKKMTYADFLTQIKTSLTSGEHAMLSLDDIVDVMTDDGTKVPAASLLYDLNATLSPLIREQNCINNGASGIRWDLDELMALVHAGKMDEFAIGDYFIDGGVTWRIFAKNHYSRWAFDGTTSGGDVPPNHIVCLPDTSLGSYKFNSSNTNTGGYAGSSMPANMVTEYNKLSTKLKGYVKETQIFENNKSAWASVERYMRLPTVIEMTGNQGWADQYSGGVCSQFPLAQAAKHRIKDYLYWLLDPVASNATLFCLVDHTGRSTMASATTSCDVRPEIVLA